MAAQAATQRPVSDRVRPPAGRVRPGPGASREEKERWIRSKYERRELLAPAPAAAELSQLLVDAVCRSDVRAAAQLLVHCSPEHVNAAVSARDARTPLHLAAALSNLAIVQLLLWVCVWVVSVCSR